MDVSAVCRAVTDVIAATIEMSRESDKYGRLTGKKLLRGLAQISPLAEAFIFVDGFLLLRGALGEASAVLS